MTFPTASRLSAAWSRSTPSAGIPDTASRFCSQPTPAFAVVTGPTTGGRQPACTAKKSVRSAPTRSQRITFEFGGLFLWLCCVSSVSCCLLLALPHKRRARLVSSNQGPWPIGILSCHSIGPLLTQDVPSSMRKTIEAPYKAMFGLVDFLQLSPCRPLASQGPFLS